MMQYSDIQHKLPEAKKVVIVLSGGMDSTISARILCEKYGKENVFALTFDYGQKQVIEVEKARESSAILGIGHKVLDLSILGIISEGFSANTDKSIAMPTIKEVLGDPRPKTYVPNRNMILFSLAASYAEVNSASVIFTGLQIHDSYGYWDTSTSFVNSINSVLSQNRNTKIKVVAPFGELSKKEEIEILLSLDRNLDLLEHTITCYNPDDQGHSCGKCPSCSERIANFAMAGFMDVIPYSKQIAWGTLIFKYQEVE